MRNERLKDWVILTAGVSLMAISFLALHHTGTADPLPEYIVHASRFTNELLGQVPNRPNQLGLLNVVEVFPFLLGGSLLLGRFVLRRTR